ncbi:MepB family protein [Kordia jejudonensis]|uniref:MepB family protein n=1 Tax=Kordia jejudonensis TaxID=1348245 RepID=UPI0006290FC8|nr:MepB family protein [Kordia jejudonensis]
MKNLNKELPFYVAKAKKRVYDVCGFDFLNFHESEESKEYEACTFQLDTFQIISRTAKITPKKVGQFVTIWKRNSAGITMPFQETDAFDFIIINVQKDENFGQFVFPKSVLIQKRIVSTKTNDGKRGIRVYPVWDKPTSTQAMKTQMWQLQYFFQIDAGIELVHFKSLLTI